MSRKASRANSGTREEEEREEIEFDANSLSDTEVPDPSQVVPSGSNEQTSAWNKIGSAVRATLGDATIRSKKKPVVTENEFALLQERYEALCNRLSDLEIANARNPTPYPQQGEDLHKDVRRLLDFVDVDDPHGAAEPDDVVRCKARQKGDINYCLLTKDELDFSQTSSDQDRIANIEKLLLGISKSQKVLKVKDLDRIPKLPSRNHGGFHSGMGSNAFSKLLERFEKSGIKYKYGESPLPYLVKAQQFIESMSARVSDMQYKTMLESGLDKSNRSLFHSLYSHTRNMDYRAFQEYLMVLLADASTDEACVDRFYQYDHTKDKSTQNLTDLVVQIYDLMTKANLSPEAAHSRLHHILPDYCQDALNKLKHKAEQTSWQGIGVETIIHSLSPYRVRIDEWIKASKKSVKGTVHRVVNESLDIDRHVVHDDSVHAINDDEHVDVHEQESSDVHYNAAYRAAKAKNQGKFDSGDTSKYRHPNYRQNNVEGDRSNQSCLNCLRQGHVAENCLKPKRCLLCNKNTHSTPECSDYMGASIVADACPICKTATNLDLFHTVQVCKFNPLSPYYIGPTIKKITAPKN